MIKNPIMIVESVNLGGQFKQTTLANYEVPNGCMLVEGVLGVANVKNRNNRFYTLEEYQKHVKDFNQRIQESNGILGEMEHPKSMNIDLNNVSHKILEVRIDENGVVNGKILLLDTPKGLIAQSIVKSGSALPISSRALGNVDNSGKTTLEYLSTWDLVGTSGFAQANVKQVHESLEVGGAEYIVESLSVNLNQDLNIIAENSNDYVHVSEIKTIVENLVAQSLPLMINENKEEKVDETKNVDLKSVDERFENVYGVAVEKWVIEEYTPKLMNGVQTWIVEQLLPQVQNWVVEQYSPQVQGWVSNEFAPKFGEVLENWTINEFAPQVQNWVVEQYSPQVQGWVVEQYSPQVQGWVSNEFAPKFGEIVENWTTSEFAPKFGEILESYKGGVILENKEEKVDETKEVKETEEKVDETKETETVKESKIFKSNLLNKIDTIVESAKEIAPIVKEEQPKRIDESGFYFAPAWLKNAPQTFKNKWVALTESQQAEIYRKASIRMFTTNEDVVKFWNSVDFERILESKIPETITRDFVNINENKSQNPRMNIGKLASSMR